MNLFQKHETCETVGKELSLVENKIYKDQIRDDKRGKKRQANERIVTLKNTFFITAKRAVSCIYIYACVLYVREKHRLPDEKCQPN